MKIQVTGMALKNHRDNNGLMAHGVVSLPELNATVKGVALCHRDGEFVAFAPTLSAGGHGIVWSADGTLARDVAAAMLEMFQKMGGQMPASTPEKAANSDAAWRRIAARKARGAEREEVDRIFGRE